MGDLAKRFAVVIDTIDGKMIKLELYPQLKIHGHLLMVIKAIKFEPGIDLLYRFICVDFDLV